MKTIGNQSFLSIRPYWEQHPNPKHLTLFCFCYSESLEMALWDAEFCPPLSTWEHSSFLPIPVITEWPQRSPLFFLFLALLQTLPLHCVAIPFLLFSTRNYTRKVRHTHIIIALRCSSELAVTLSFCMFFIMRYFKYTWFIQFPITFSFFYATLSSLL